MGMEWDIDKNFIDKFFISFIGKKVGVLGHDKCGKSVLFHLIQEKEIKPSNGPTDLPIKSETLKTNFQYKGSKKSILIKKIIDTPGDKERPNTRKKVFRTLDYIIYFIRSDLIVPLNKNIIVTGEMHQDRLSARLALRQDFMNFKAWANDDFLFKKRRQIIVVANHFAHSTDGEIVIPIPDEKTKDFFVPNFLDGEVKQNYSRTFKKIVSEIIGGQLLNDVQFVVGSLASNKLGNQLVISIFHKLI
ncbi:hypothetical protein [Coleofasciculus sp. E1-EBD-02]|uniref:hypothetical protein n=1 Tax=Coleofasciculus sp. E1-EBD-02 TaxID=3068481 RepID=UPI003305250B